jgi:hypothetical protein
VLNSEVSERIFFFVINEMISELKKNDSSLSENEDIKSVI